MSQQQQIVSNDGLVGTYHLYMERNVIRPSRFTHIYTGLPWLHLWTICRLSGLTLYWEEYGMLEAYLAMGPHWSCSCFCSLWWSGSPDTYLCCCWYWVLSSYSPDVSTSPSSCQLFISLWQCFVILLFYCFFFMTTSTHLRMYDITVTSPIHTGFGCGFIMPIPRLRLSVNLLEAARDEMSLRLWYASGGSIGAVLLENRNHCEQISRLYVSRACRSDRG